MSKVDRRKYEVDESIKVFLKSGEIVEGTIYAVQYEEPVNQDPDPRQRHSFKYIVYVGDKYVRDITVADPKTGKLSKQKRYEPVYQTIPEDQLRD